MIERDIFIAALQKDPDQRQAYLDEACAQQPELRKQVEDLLRLHEAAGSFLQNPAAESAATRTCPDAQDPPSAERSGTTIGKYKLLELIGEGGMGSVWMAQQTEPVKRVVALKLIKAGMDSKQVIARFEAERQALALMDHMNIARVLDAGTTGAGRPYFVMDLVKGVPITKYCDEHHLTPRQRLELFIPICQAIQHAHQKGIIHRDLKPSNVLVAQYDGKPVPKIIDFGVAKAAGQSLTEKTLVTGFGNIVGTLEYMSPEQAEPNQLDIDTRSDIYSLGVLLYELLTGSPPFTRKDLEKAGMLEMLRVIREQEPSKPSTKLSTAEGLPTLAANRGTEPGKLTKLVRGELDWIVMKALEKDRNRRYETANGFAMDVQRYLADEPVLACPPSVGYRLRKFMRRNKTGLAVAALVLAFLVLLGTVAGWALRNRAAREQDAALESARKLALTEEGIRQALERAGNSLGELRATLKKPGGVRELLNQPARWELFLRTAQAERTQASRLIASAEGNFDAEVTQALHRLDQQLAADEADHRLALRLEKIRLDRATWAKDRFDFRTAAEQYPKAFAGFCDLTQDPETVAARLAASPIKEQLVGALDDWAWVARMSRDKDLVVQLLAVARRAAPDPDWGDRLRQVEVWGNQEALAGIVAKAPPAGLSPQLALLVAYLLGSDTPSAVTWLRRAQAQHPADFWLALELGNALLYTEPAEAAVWCRVALATRPTNATAYTNLGNALDRQNKFLEAIEAHQKAIKFDPKHTVAYNNLGATFHNHGKPAEAIAAYRKAIESNPNDGNIYRNLGDALSDHGKLDEAVVVLHQAIKLGGNRDWTYSVLSDALRHQGKLDEAVAAAEKGININPSPKYPDAYMSLGSALVEQKKLPQAIAAYKKAVDIKPNWAPAYIGLGNALHHNKRWDDAVAAYEKAIELNPKSAQAYYNLGNTLAAQKKPAEAIRAHRKAIELNPKSADAYCNLGATLTEQGNHEAAVDAYQKGIKLDPNNATIHYNLGNVLNKLKSWNAAAAAFQRAIELDAKVAVFHNSLGIALLGQQKLKEAIVACEKAIELDPRDASAHDGFGQVLRKQGRLDEAVAAHRKAIEIDAKVADHHRHLGIALAYQRKLNEAIDAFQKAIDLDPQSAVAHDSLGYALHDLGRLDNAVAAFRKAIDVDPKFANAYNGLGTTLVAQKKFPEAIVALHKVIELDPKDPRPHNNLGIALSKQGKLDAAVAAFRTSAELGPNNAGVFRNLGQALRLQKNWAEAAAAFGEAVKLDPTCAIYVELGITLANQRKLAEAISVYRKAIELDPKDPYAYYNLGHALGQQRKQDEAMAAYGKAIELRPGYPEAHCNLGLILRDLGQFAQALEFLQKGHELGRRQPNWSNPSGGWVKECERLLALDKRLPDVLAGKAASAAEQLSLADLCLRYKKRYADAALLYDKAFAAEPKLAEGLGLSRRYDAAVAAVLAAGGKGVGVDRLDAADKTRLRGQALDWLAASLATVAKHLADGPSAASAIEEGLRRWLDEPRLNSVRDAKELAELPDEERQRWLKLWGEVRDLVRRAETLTVREAGPVQDVGDGLKLHGKLEGKTRTLVYQVRLSAGKTYVIDMVSPDEKALDPYLVLKDADSKLLAEDDDSGGGLNARLIYRSPRDGVYRIHATSFNMGRGEFTLTVRETK